MICGEHVAETGPEGAVAFACRVVPDSLNLACKSQVDVSPRLWRGQVFRKIHPQFLLYFTFDKDFVRACVALFGGLRCCRLWQSLRAYGRWATSR